MNSAPLLSAADADSIHALCEQMGARDETLSALHALAAGRTVCISADDAAALEKYRGGVQTHGPDCWSWGWRHYSCAEAEIQRLRALPTSQRIAGEQFTNSERGMVRNVANTLMRRAQKKGQTHPLADVLIGLSNTVPSLPSLAELERDAARYRLARDSGLLDGLVSEYETNNDLDESEVGSAEYSQHCDEAIDAARAKEAKR